MKCKKCKKDFKAGVKAAYALGVLNGEEGATLEAKTQVKLNRMRATNKALLKELKYKDKYEPLSDCKVWLERDFFERLIKTFHYYQIYTRENQLKKILQEQIKSQVDFDGSAL